MDVFFVRLSYLAFKIKKLTLKMAEKKDTDTPESSGYEKESDQWKADLALARRQVNFKKVKKKLIKYFELLGNVCFTHIFKLNLPIILDFFLKCRDSTYRVMTQERLYKTFYLVKRIPLLSLMKCHWLVNKIHCN